METTSWYICIHPEQVRDLLIMILIAASGSCVTFVVVEIYTITSLFNTTDWSPEKELIVKRAQVKEIPVTQYTVKWYTH